MELQTLLIGVAGCFLSAIVIYLISLFSMREKTFEEVIEEQRLRHEEEEKKARSEKKAEKGDRKKYRKFKEKTKDKIHHQQQQQQQAASVEPAVEATYTQTSNKSASVDKPTPVKELTVTVESSSPVETNNKVKSPKSAKKQQKAASSKPLVAHQSPTDESPTLAKAEIVSKIVQPHQTEKSVKQTSSSSSGTQQNNQDQQQHANSTKSKSRSDDSKAERKNQDKTKTTKSTKQLVEDIPQQTVGLQVYGQNTSKNIAENGKEIENFQALNDVGIKKEGKKESKKNATAVVVNQNIPESNGSVSEPIKKEKRTKKGAVVEDVPGSFSQLISSVKDTSLNNAEIATLFDLLVKKQSDSSGVNKKTQKGDLLIISRKELEEKNNVIKKASKQHEEESQKWRSGYRTVQAQVKKNEEQVENLTNRLKKMENATVSKEKYQKVIEENNALKKAPKPVVAPPEMVSLKQKVQIMEKELDNNIVKLNASEKNRTRFEEKVKELEADKVKNESILAMKMDEFQVAARNFEKEKSILQGENAKVNEAVRQFQTQCVSLKNQLQALYTELESKDTDSNKKMKEMEDELLMVKDENRILQEENKLVKEKPVTMDVALGERQEPAGAPNGDVQQEAIGSTKVALVEHERILGEKETEIFRLASELKSRETETTARLEEKDSEIKSLTSTLNSNTTEMEKQLEKMEKFKEEIEFRRNKNDDLRKKNWKAMEAVENAEKTVEKVNSAIKSTREESAELLSNNKSVLKCLFPDISIDESLEYSVWMKTFANKAAENLQSKCIQNLSEINKLKDKLQETTAELDILSEESKETAKLLNSKKESLAELEDYKTKSIELQSTSEAKINELKGELDEAQRKCSETEEKYNSLKSELLHEKVTDSQIEVESLTTQVTDSQREVESLTTQVTDSQREVESLTTQVTDSQREVESLTTQVTDSQRGVESLTTQLKQSSENQTTLKLKVKEYKSLLSVTHEKLQLLQCSVEAEEMKWKTALSNANKDVEYLKEKQHNQDFTESIESLKSQITEKEELSEILDNELKKNRDLSQTIVKLNGIIKTGQDALAQEQKIVEKLKEELTDKNSIGPTNATQEIEQLKQKLKQTEKEFEKGYLHNKVLSQKLASTVSGTDVGTSV